MFFTQLFDPKITLWISFVVVSLEIFSHLQFYSILLFLYFYLSKTKIYVRPVYLFCMYFQLVCSPSILKYKCKIESISLNFKKKIFETYQILCPFISFLNFILSNNFPILRIEILTLDLGSVDNNIMSILLSVYFNFLPVDKIFFFPISFFI